MSDSTASLTCQHFGDCGGCSSLPTPIAEQRKRKALRVGATLGTHADGLELTFTDSPTSSPRHDRMRVLYPVQPATGGLTMGLYRKGTHEVVELQSCEIQHPALTELARLALDILRRQSLSPYDEAAHRGLLRAFTARLAPTTGELLIGLVTTSPDLHAADDLAEALLAAADELPRVGDQDVRAVGVVHNVNPDRGNALIGDDVRTLVGRGHIFERFGDLTFRISFLSFNQLHRHAEQLLYAPALAMLGPLEGLRVIDAFGGIGPFAIRLARRGVEAVTLVELHPSSCADARHNVAANGLANVQIVESAFDSAVLERSADLLVVDPTRAGLGVAGCAHVGELGPPRVLYVACGIEALARDLGRLPEYRLEKVQLADLFPHTDHVEILALLRRRPGN